MKASLNLAGLVCLTLALTACKSPDDYKVEVPKIEEPKIDISQILKDMNEIDFDGCSKDERSQDFSQQGVDETVLVEGAVESQETETLACDQKTKKIGPRDTSSIESNFFVGPEKTLPEAAAYVEIENTRSCSKIKLNVKNEKSQLSIPGMVQSLLYEDGTISLTVSSATVSILDQLPVRDGKNLIQIRYFNAEEKEISSQDFVVDLQLKRTLIEGVRTVDICADRLFDF